jgi:hypothetical protein
VFLDSRYCNNFDFRKASKYVRYGFNLDEIHLVYLKYNYKGFHYSVLEAIRYDFYWFSFTMHKTGLVIMNTLTSSFSKGSSAAAGFASRVSAAVRSLFFSLTPFIMSYILKERESYNRVTDINAAHYADRYFQRPATETMSNIIDFHNDLMVVLIFISIFIIVVLSVCLYNYATLSINEFYCGSEATSRMNHNAFAEVIFTAVPAMIIYLIAAPSFALLYSNNDWLEKEAELTVNITGHQ